MMKRSGGPRLRGHEQQQPAQRRLLRDQALQPVRDPRALPHGGRRQRHVRPDQQQAPGRHGAEARRVLTKSKDFCR